jgi:hypothetical protein
VALSPFAGKELAAGQLRRKALNAMVRIGGAALLLVVALSTACARGPLPPGPLLANDTLPPRGLSYYFATFSPDRSRAAVIGLPPEAGLALGIVEHGRVRRVSRQDALVSDAVWLPDSKHLVMAWQQDTEDLLEHPERFSIIDTTGRVVREVPVKISLVASEETGMVLHPDGRHVVLGMRPLGPSTAFGDLQQVDLDSGEVRPVFVTAGVDETSPKYLPDARMLYLAQWLDQWGNIASRIELFDPRTGRRTPVSHEGEGPSRFALLAGPPTVVVYNSSGGDGSTVGLWAVDLESGTHRRLSEEPFHQPSADPDGRHVLVTRLDDFDKTTLVRLEIIDEHGQIVSSVRSP